jgi:hypothetical protein
LLEKELGMKRIAFLVLGLALSTSLFAQQFYSVKNPNTVKPEGSPRPASAVQADKDSALSCLAAIADYVKANGVDKTVQEINKGRQGAFANKFPKTHFYLSMSKKKGAKGWPIIAHGSNPALVGFDVTDVSMFMDHTGWQYLTDLFAKMDTTKIGVVDGLLWADPEWANGKKCRMFAYNTFLTSGSDQYWLYFAIWLDE